MRKPLRALILSTLLNVVLISGSGIGRAKSECLTHSKFGSFNGKPAKRINDCFWDFAQCSTKENSIVSSENRQKERLKTPLRNQVHKNNQSCCKQRYQFCIAKITGSPIPKIPISTEPVIQKPGPVSSVAPKELGSEQCARSEKQAEALSSKVELLCQLVDCQLDDAKRLCPHVCSEVPDTSNSPTTISSVFTTNTDIITTTEQYIATQSGATTDVSRQMTTKNVIPTIDAEIPITVSHNNQGFTTTAGIQPPLSSILSTIVPTATATKYTTTFKTSNSHVETSSVPTKSTGIVSHLTTASTSESKETKYWRTIGGENCPLGAVVETADNCIEAASQLRLIYHPTGIYKPSEAPAGCWVTGAMDVNVYFNNITDPALTDPVGPHLQGICTTIGNIRKPSKKIGITTTGILDFFGILENSTEILWSKEFDYMYCPNNNRLIAQTQNECQSLCEQEEACVGISYSQLNSDLCYICKDDNISSANNDVGFYRRPVKKDDILNEIPLTGFAIDPKK